MTRLGQRTALTLAMAGLGGTVASQIPAFTCTGDDLSH